MALRDGAGGELRLPTRSASAARRRSLTYSAGDGPHRDPRCWPSTALVPTQYPAAAVAGGAARAEAGGRCTGGTLAFPHVVRGRRL